ncbi:hypothetical protein D3C86_1447380 [compost metagenome]
MRRHTDRQRHGPLGATRLARLDGARHGSSRTGDHHLARRIEIHRAHHLALRRLGASRQHVGIIQPEDSRHAALTGRHRLLHQLAAQLHQLDCFSERQAARSNQRRVFTQAMAGNERRLQTTLSAPQTPQGNGCGKDRRLGLVGLIELLFRPLLAQGPEVVAKRFGSLGKSIDNDLLRAVPSQHRQRLRALARKDECEGCRHVNEPLWSYRRINSRLAESSATN